MGCSTTFQLGALSSHAASVAVELCWHLLLQDYVLGDRKDEEGLPVKSGLHEVDMVKRRMQPCYWPGTTHRVIRGSWFIDKGSGYAPLKVCIQLGPQKILL